MTIREWREQLGIPWRAGLELLKAAHRGGVVDERRPENSLEALLAAVQAGYDLIETDLRSTADDYPVVFHDRDARRICGDQREVAALTLEEFKRLRFLGAQNGPVSFDEWVDALPAGIGVQLELKVVGAAPPFYSRVADALQRRSVWRRTLLFGQEAPDYLRERTLNWLSPQEALARARQGKITPGRCWFMARVAELDETLISTVSDAGVLAFVAINTHHYPPEEAVEAGLADLRRVLPWPLRGIQLDSIYAAPLF